jgi:hypothetical protein
MLRILGTTLVVVALSFLILTLITAMCAFVLAFQTRGAPDQTALSHFAARVNPKLMPWLEEFLTLLVATWVTRRTQQATTIDGLFIGILAGLLSLAVILAFHGRLGLHTLLFSLIVVGLGWFGGFIGQKRAGRR